MFSFSPLSLPFIAPFNMTITINDTFTTLDELTNAIHSFIQTQSFQFTQPIIKPKLVTLTCIGHKAFMCDSMVQAILRKKDNQWVVKKIRLLHRCPTEVHTIGVNNYIFKKAGDVAGKSIGEVVKVLMDRGVNVSYASVFDAFGNGGDLIGAYRDEFMKINPREDLRMVGDNSHIYAEFTKLVKLVRNVVELKFVERHGGFVVLGVVYDPHDFPIIFNVCVSDGLTLQETYALYIKQSPHGLKYITESERDFNECFIKTRGLCREVFKTEKELKKIETLWGICNGYIRRKQGGKKRIDENLLASEDDATALDANEFDGLIALAQSAVGVPESRFVTRGGLFGLNNMPDPDLEYIPNNAYTTGFIECIDNILSSLTLSPIKEDINPSVRMQVERNIENKELIDGVNLDNFECPCGRFKEFLIPCVHACAVTEDPMKYVSIVYSKNLFEFEYGLLPVIENVAKPKVKTANRTKKRKMSKNNEGIKGLEADKENIHLN